MEFEKGRAPFSYEVSREAGEDVLYFNYDGVPFPPLFSYPEVTERTVDALSENPGVNRLVFVRGKSYNYDSRETNYLLEISSLYTYLLKQEKVLSQEKISPFSEGSYPKRYNQLYSFLFLLKRDPIAAYFELRRIIVDAKVELNSATESIKVDVGNYLKTLEKIMMLFDKTKIIVKAREYFSSYVKGSTEIYSKLFQPDIIPNFTFTRIVSDLPTNAEIIKQYEVKLDEFDVSNVTILKIKDESKLLYHLSPPEANLREEENVLMNLARRVLIEHQPKAEEFTDVSRTRQVFFNVAKDLLRDLSASKGMNADYNLLNKLATILVRHTIGFGLVEVLLKDKFLQDISLNAPISQTPIYVRHNDYDECSTNILPSQEDADSWAAKFRMISGRPLDEANPILDSQLEIGNLRARIAIIQNPLSPDGLSYSIRRHRESPWTLSLFIKNKMINPLTAGLLSFLIDGGRTLLVAGTRSSGKTSLLGSLMLEINPKTRIITVEDSLELPIESLRKLKYNVVRMKVRSALLKTTTEVSAEDGIRTSLRLGDSSLIVGEVRSGEAKALYEAMRVGALANVVAGTIHGASPYGVYDRVVNDLGVPKTSFKATDIIVICNPIKSADGLHSFRRVIEVSEIRKHWEEDPLREKGFRRLMEYSVEEDKLNPTDDLINGDSEIIKDIASKVKGWAGDWDAVWDNITLRAKIKEELVKVSIARDLPQILEAPFNVLSNHMFYEISEEVIKEIGLPKSEYVFPRWKKWLGSEVEKMS